METADFQQQLTRFARAMTGDASAAVTNIRGTSGHAGFTNFFDLTAGGETKSYFIRLAPPGVKLEGTADVLRQVAAVKALDGTDVPHAEVTWSGDDEQWFGRPYFVQPELPGDVLRGEWLLKFPRDQRPDLARQAMTALAGIHKVDPARAPYLGEFWGFEFDVTRWDRFYERAADQHLLALQPRVRELLLEKIPHDTRIGIYHGDFQWGNLVYSADGKLQAVIDWELTGIGATLNDVGWICAFNEPRAWANPEMRGMGAMPQASEIEEMYREAWGSDPGDIGWFKALAVYKFGIITGFNLMLHRRGKRPDPSWEETAKSMPLNMEYAMEQLS
jgi:aminoglycoside phosphotransferase (APT) family kinase protein